MTARRSARDLRPFLIAIALLLSGLCLCGPAAGSADPQPSKPTSALWVATQRVRADDDIKHGLEVRLEGKRGEVKARKGYFVPSGTMDSGSGTR